jgi:hypothetical protein
VDDGVGEVGHAVAARGRLREPHEELEPHERETAGLAELLLDRVPEQAGHLDQREVGAEPDGVDGVRRAGHRASLLVSNSKQD